MSNESQVKSSGVGEPSPLSEAQPWDLVAEAYARTVKPTFESYANDLFELMSLPSSGEAVDVACGPGTASLLLAQRGLNVCGLDISERMLAQFRQSIPPERRKNVEIVQGNGQSLPYGSERFDVGVSMFGLMFFPDRQKGFRELSRVLKPGGKVGVTSWAPMESSEWMTLLFNALQAANPAPEKPAEPKSTEKVVASLQDPLVFERELLEAGFEDVQVLRSRQGMKVTDWREFWDSMVESGAPIALARQKVGEKVWREREPLAIEHLTKNGPSLPAVLHSDAWFGVGTKVEN